MVEGRGDLFRPTFLSGRISLSTCSALFPVDSSISMCTFVDFWSFNYVAH